MSSRPDRPLVVKCTFDRWNKRITFASARNCSYELLRAKVEQCFSLYATSYAIAYKDDDGEVTDITTDSDLTEAIQYFQAGGDDPPISSTASILSGRSFGGRKITLRVNITVDYDGPSLSDTSSLASLEEYKGKNGSEESLSFSTSPSADFDDDSVTVSSRDAGAHSRGGPYRPSPLHSEEVSYDQPTLDTESSGIDESLDTRDQNDVSGSPGLGSVTGGRTLRGEDPFSDAHHLEPACHHPEESANLFGRLKFEEDVDDLVSSGHQLRMTANDRGTAWLRDQNARTIKSMLGALPEPSESDSASMSLEQDVDAQRLGGDLALQRDPRGKYYYSYTSAASSSASQSHDSGYEDATSMKDGIGDILPSGENGHPRPTSMHLTWLASQQKDSHNHRLPSTSQLIASSSRSRAHSDSFAPPHRESLYEDYISESSDIPPDVLHFMALSGPPRELLTSCSECGVFLDAIRYVCSTCGEKKPVMCLEANGISKGKDKNTHIHENDNSFAYPPPAHRNLASSPSMSVFYGSSYSSSNSFGEQFNKPLPSLPLSPASSRTLIGTSPLVSPSASIDSLGYELCSGCIESAGVIHALHVSLAPGTTPGSGNISPSSPEDAQRVLSQWRRSAPKQKGQLRHAYFERVWGHEGWEDVEQDDIQECKCSTCNTVIAMKRYKCASCQNFNLCRACYSQVHDIHPSHAFLVILEKPVRSRSEPDYLPSLLHDSLLNSHEERSMKHPGVKCAHCLLDIVGARFHCAICESVDICSNCESAGLPGNLDSSDGGHISSHIMIKIPYPLETTEVQTASRRAIHLWTGRDAAHVLSSGGSKPSSVYSAYTRTVVGSGVRHQLDSMDCEMSNHHIFCSACSSNVYGDRYQCANCPSSPVSYSLCESCEERSYVVHDPMHVFFKLPRPVIRPLESPFPFLPKLYKSPAGPPGGLNNANPKEYLKSLLHSTALCDRCMERIQGAWFRCAYCAKDLCSDCEALDTHDDTHVFIVFKAPIDMPHFRQLANLDNPHDSPPIISYPVYR